MRAGFARMEITPETSCRMAGFDRRKLPSSGILDSLYVSVIALFEEDREPFFFCSYDILGADRAFCSAMRQVIAEAFSLEDHRIWISATHTHSAPSGVFSTSDVYDTRYISILAEKTLSAAKTAAEQAEEVTCHISRIHIPGIASRRNQGRAGAGFAMPVQLLRFTGTGEPITLCLFSCHPTILDEKNTRYSRDLPGAIAAAVTNGERFLFLNGACADLSTRFTRTASSPEELTRLGGLAAAGIDGSPALERTVLGPIRSTEKELTLSRDAGLSGEKRDQLLAVLREMEAACDDPAAKREYDSRIAVLERQNVKAEPARKIRICAIDLGPFALLSLPFEVDSEDGDSLEEILSGVAGKPVYVVCYTGGYDGYLPSGLPLGPNSSYEDFASRYAPESRGQVWECAKQCVMEFVR